MERNLRTPTPVRSYERKSRQARNSLKESLKSSQQENNDELGGPNIQRVHILPMTINSLGSSNNEANPFF